MTQYHDSTQQVNYLRQSLAQDKKPLGVFIGAGCPSSIRTPNNGNGVPLIPDIAGLTTAICDQITAAEDCRDTLDAAFSQCKADECDDPNVEDILSHIRSLRAVAGNDSVRGLTATDLDALDDRICDIIVKLMEQALPASDTPYHKLAAWVGAIDREHPVQVFTTNYDLLFEQALEEHRVPYFDGFVGSCRPFFDPRAIDEDPLPSRWARLWKFHGSINWCQDETGSVFRVKPTSPSERRVIHPSHLKYDQSRRMPYLAMIDRLRAFLKRPASVLVTCGYSFRDDHLNEVIVQGLEGNPGAAAFALLFDDLHNYDAAAKLAATRRNLSILADDAAVIGTKCADWITRPATDNGLQSPGVDWTPNEAQGSDDHQQARFKLGDFTRFGQFLEDIIGMHPQNVRATNAE